MIEGLHHVTAVTGDAPRNVDFYVRVLGLRMVKKTINFDQPDVYHLYYADESGTPGSVMTFFEFPGAQPGRAGDGMVHTVQWRVAATASLDFWARRLTAEGAETDREHDVLRFADPEGLAHELVVSGAPDGALPAEAPDVSAAHALRGLEGVRAYASDPEASAALLEALGMTAEATGTWEARGAQRGATLAYDPPPAPRPQPGAGTVHHVAWSLADDAELEQFRQLAAAARARPTQIIDRQYFHSVYFREPSGVLFDLASRDVGFAIDEPVATLGQALQLPAQHEHLRSQLESALTPIADPRRDAA